MNASQRIVVGYQKFKVLFSELLRSLTDQELAGWKRDIQTRGIVVPVIVDQDLGVIDGIHRLEIASALGLTRVPMEMRPGLTHAEKEELALALNEHRRQLSREDRKELAKKLRQEGKSIRDIVDRLGADKNTILNDVSEFQTPEITGRDGKVYAATRPTTVRVNSPDEAAAAAVLLEDLSPAVSAAYCP
ncbi:MAG TPA: ParB N-terminal domain-containing protein [Gemmataceae bacterium]|nr:ParB N-terminal domain-containing protein [Gemmataceae bacterium]